MSFPAPGYGEKALLCDSMFLIHKVTSRVREIFLVKLILPRKGLYGFFYWFNQLRQIRCMRDSGADFLFLRISAWQCESGREFQGIIRISSHM